MVCKYNQPNCTESDPCGPCYLDAAQRRLDGIDLISDERKRQVQKEGWTSEHDDQHDCGELAQAAAHLIEAYFNSDDDQGLIGGNLTVASISWHHDDWVQVLYRKHRGIRALVIAGALIAAEIDRVKRRELHSSEPCTVEQ